ncbi:MAG: hypothetical protein LBU69_00830 [Deltaproteobacteria bacterium]|nr:hypothetical protein [Deltaproteobacteria bacterium]
MTALSLLAISLVLTASQTARAATISEIFLLVPSERLMGLTAVDRRALLDRIGQGAAGYTSPSDDGHWLELNGTHSLTLFSIRDAPIVLKVFQATNGGQLLAICRSRQTYGPANANELPHETFLDLFLYSVSATNDLIQVNLADYFPPIGIWDFVTLDTITDPNALRDLQAKELIFEDCLTCHASTQDSITIDIMTVTSINGHSCAYLMPQFKLLPLSWEGYQFTKPYDRAAIPGQERLRPEPKRGIYYHDPGKWPHSTPPGCLETDWPPLASQGTVPRPIKGPFGPPSQGDGDGQRPSPAERISRHGLRKYRHQA